MYFEVWVDASKRREVISKLKEVCKAVYEVYYDYDLIVEAESEEVLKIDGVKRVRRHYDC
ncbi:MAG: hypothetical protein ABWW66_05440 [Archaeoglobaceae archaeon]